MIEAWRALADPLDLGLAVTEGPTHRLRYRNRAFDHLAGTGDDAVGRSLAEVLPHRILDAVAPLLEPKSERRSANVDLSEGDPDEDGEAVVYRATVSPLAVEGDRAGTLLELEDVSDRVEAVRRHVAVEHELRQVNERLVLAAIREQELAEEARAAARAKTEFLAAISHELRTPLNAIVGYAQLLQNGTVGPPPTDKQARSLERIRLAGEHLGQLVDELLSLQELESSSPAARSLRRMRTDANQVAREAFHMVRSRADGQVDLRLDVEEREVPMETDPQKLRQVLVNLLNNAVKFTDRGWVEMRVRARNDEHVLFAVADTGIGIEEDDLEAIFQPFARLKTGYTATATTGGTGLGLSISGHLAELLGGRIEVESTPGAGSTFTVRLPRKLPEGGN